MLRSGDLQQYGVEMTPRDRNTLVRNFGRGSRAIVNPGAYPLDYQQHWNGGR